MYSTVDVKEEAVSTRRQQVQNGRHTDEEASYYAKCRDYWSDEASGGRVRRTKRVCRVVRVADERGMERKQMMAYGDLRVVQAGVSLAEHKELFR